MLQKTSGGIRLMATGRMLTRTRDEDNSRGLRGVNTGRDSDRREQNDQSHATNLLYWLLHVSPLSVKTHPRQSHALL
jgi:hypothetical protein